MIRRIERAWEYRERTALETVEGVVSYGDLLDASARVAAALLESGGDLGEQPVPYLLPAGFGHVAVQWGIWRAGGVAVPLATMHPAPELAHVLDDTGAATVVGAGRLDPQLEARLRPLVEKRSARYRSAEELLGTRVGNGEVGRDTGLPEVAPDRRALMVYTSGTTGRPKGVVTTHANLEAQVASLIEAWGWSRNDRILHVLPLHHVHGLINALCCALASGAACEMLPRFDPAEVWRRFERGGVSLFMAVPTVYARLLEAWQAEPEPRRSLLSQAAARLRLMVSGSASLPVTRLERWREVTGHVLLERYGMTEIGMALSNPLRGERRAGTVGRPLPGVEVRRVDEQGRVLGEGEDETPAELEVRGPGVFVEYWRRPEATREAFHDGWFRTGDVAVVESGGYHRLLGRRSVDILKTGGYKVSALEIEEVLRTHPAIADCAVVGVPDPRWGERVAVAVVLRAGGVLSSDELRAWAKRRLAVYKVPAQLEVVRELPRNALGKVLKPELAARLAQSRALVEPESEPEGSGDGESEPNGGRHGGPLR